MENTDEILDLNNRIGLYPTFIDSIMVNMNN